MNLRGYKKINITFLTSTYVRRQIIFKQINKIIVCAIIRFKQLSKNKQKKYKKFSFQA